MIMNNIEPFSWLQRTLKVLIIEPLKRVYFDFEHFEISLKCKVH